MPKPIPPLTGALLVFWRFLQRCRAYGAPEGGRFVETMVYPSKMKCPKLDNVHPHPGPLPRRALDKKSSKALGYRIAARSKAPAARRGRVCALENQAIIEEFTRCDWSFRHSRGPSVGVSVTIGDFLCKATPRGEGETTPVEGHPLSFLQSKGRLE